MGNNSSSANVKQQTPSKAPAPVQQPKPETAKARAQCVDMGTFVTRSGLVLPYESRYPRTESMGLESDKIDEIEFMICKAGDSGPHVCGKNCYCVTKRVHGSLSPASSERLETMSDLFSPTTDSVQTIHKLMVIQLKPPAPHATSKPPVVLSETSDAPVQPVKTEDLSATSPWEERSGMAGGAKNKNKNKNKNKHYSTSSSSISALSDSSDSSSDPLASSSDKDKRKHNKHQNKNKNKHHKIKSSDQFSDQGLILSNSSIDTSDLYKMQSRVYGFGSDSDANSNSNSNSDFDIDNGPYDSEDSISHTDKVNDAIKKMNLRKNIFSSESREILGLNSDSEGYMKKGKKRNPKYMK